MAEEELRRIKGEEEKQRREFETEFKEVSKEMKNIRRFKEFLKQKQKERQKLEQIELEIQERRAMIAEKEKVNKKILRQLQETKTQEEKIKEAFEEIKIETGVKECSGLLSLFKELNEKANTLQVFVAELQKDISELEMAIKEKEEKTRLYDWESNN